MVFIFRYMYTPAKGMEEPPVPFSVMKMLKGTGASKLVTSASNSDQLLFNSENNGENNLREAWDRLAKECGSEVNLIAHLKKIASSKTQIEIMGADGKTFMDSPDQAERRLAAIMLVAFSGEFAIPSFSMYADGTINSKMLQQAIYKYIYNVTADAKDKKIEWDPAVDGGYKAATMLYDAGEAKVDQAISVERPIEGVQTLSEKKPGKVTDIDIPDHEEPVEKLEFTGKYEQRTFDASKIFTPSSQTTYGTAYLSLFGEAFNSANSSYLTGGAPASDETLWHMLADPNNQESLLIKLRTAPANKRQAWYNTFHNGPGGTEQDFIKYVNLLTRGTEDNSGKFGNGNWDESYKKIWSMSDLKNLAVTAAVLNITTIAQNPELVNYCLQHARVDVKLVPIKSESVLMELRAYFDYATGVLTLTNAIPKQAKTEVNIKGTEFGFEIDTYFPSTTLFADLGWAMKTRNFEMTLFGDKVNVADTKEQKFYAIVGSLLQLSNTVSFQPSVLALYKTQTANFPIGPEEKSTGSTFGLSTTLRYNKNGKVSPYINVGVYRVQDYSKEVSMQEVLKIGSDFKFGKFDLNSGLKFNFSNKSKTDFEFEFGAKFDFKRLMFGASYKQRRK